MSYTNFHKFHIQFRLQNLQEARCEITALKPREQASHLISLPIQSHWLVYVHQVFRNTVLGGGFDESTSRGTTMFDVNTLSAHVSDLFLVITHEHRVQLDVFSVTLPRFVVPWKVSAE